MVKRFVKIPFSNNLRTGADKIHYVWIDADSITHVEYRNGNKDNPNDVITRVHYLNSEGKESWYQSTAITPEEVIAKINSTSISSNDKQLLDSELSNTLMQTQVVLKDALMERQNAEAERDGLKSKLSAAEAEINTWRFKVSAELASTETRVKALELKQTLAKSDRWYWLKNIIFSVRRWLEY